MNPGDRVIVRRSFRARGIGAGPGGWKWEDRKGTVTYVTRNNVWVKIDTAPWIDFVHKFSINKVRKVEE